MKASNLLLTFFLALMVSLTVQSQSNSNHVISINDDDQVVHIEYEDGEVSLLKIDGVTISKNDYDSYDHLIKKYRKRTQADYYSTDNNDYSDDVQVRLLRNIKSYLSKNENLNSSDYEFKLTTKYIKLNGKKLDKDRLYDCLGIFENTAGYEMTRGSYFHVDIEPGSRSVSLSIND